MISTIGKLMSVLLIASLFCTVFMGCGTNDLTRPQIHAEEEADGIEEEEEESNEEERDYISQGKTPYMILNEDSFSAIDDYTVEVEKLEDIDEDASELTFLEEEHPKVQEVLVLIEEYLNLVFNVDYLQYDKFETKKYYSPALIARYEEENYFSNGYEYIMESKIQDEYLGFEPLYIVFDQTQNRVKVRGTVKTRFIEASDDFLSEWDVEKNKSYNRDGYMWLENYNNRWLFEFKSFHRWIVP